MPKRKNDLGKALIKAKNRQHVSDQEFFKQNKTEKQEVHVKKNLTSVTERDTLAEFLYDAELSKKKFNVS